MWDNHHTSHCLLARNRTCTCSRAWQTKYTQAWARFMKTIELNSRLDLGSFNSFLSRYTSNSTHLDPYLCIKQQHKCLNVISPFPQLEACAHPLFDELRAPNAYLPNGRPLPPLFDFSPEGEYKYMFCNTPFSILECCFGLLAVAVRSYRVGRCTTRADTTTHSGTFEEANFLNWLAEVVFG